MKKLFKIIPIILTIFQFISCKKDKDYVQMIPADSEFVIQVNPKTIAEKGELKDVAQLEVGKLTLQNLEATDPKFKELTLQILENPSDFGVDLISPLYIFGKKQKNKTITALVMNMNNKSDFENQLKIIYQSNIDFETINGYTFVKGIRKPLIAWNKKQFYFLAGEYGTSTKNLEAYFNQIIENKNALTENNSFKDFLKNTQDVNIWYTGNFINNFTKNQVNSANDLDFSHSSWSTYLSFNKDNISFTQKFHPDPATKVKIKEHPMWKTKINTDFYKYFPGRSYFNFSLAVHPANTRYIFNNDNPITDFLDNYEIDKNLIAESFEGELLFNIYDFEIAKDFNLNDYFGQHKNFEKNQIIPQFVLAGRMKNKAFFDHLITSLGKSIKQEDDFYAMRINSNLHLYFAYKYNILYVTNNQIQMKNFIFNRVEKLNFVQSKFSSRAKNSMFGYVNLDYSQYPPEIQSYLMKQLPFPYTKDIDNIMNQFTDIQFNVTDEYTKSGTLNFKKGDKNTLYRVIKSIDQLYVLFTSNVYSTPDESN